VAAAVGVTDAERAPRAVAGAAAGRAHRAVALDRPAAPADALLAGRAAGDRAVGRAAPGIESADAGLVVGAEADDAAAVARPHARAAHVAVPEAVVVAALVQDDRVGVDAAVAAGAGRPREVDAVHLHVGFDDPRAAPARPGHADRRAAVAPAGLDPPDDRLVVRSARDGRGHPAVVGREARAGDPGPIVHPAAHLGLGAREAAEVGRAGLV